MWCCWNGVLVGAISFLSGIFLLRCRSIFGNIEWWGRWHLWHLWSDLHWRTKCPERRQFWHKLFSLTIVILPSCDMALNLAHEYTECVAVLHATQALVSWGLTSAACDTNVLWLLRLSTGLFLLGTETECSAAWVRRFMNLRSIL